MLFFVPPLHSLGGDKGRLSLGSFDLLKFSLENIFTNLSELRHGVWPVYQVQYLHKNTSPASQLLTLAQKIYVNIPYFALCLC